MKAYYVYDDFYMNYYFQKLFLVRKYLSGVCMMVFIRIATLKNYYQYEKGDRDFWVT